MDPDLQAMWEEGAGLQKLWMRSKSATRAGRRPFDESQAVALMLVKLECCEMALRKIAATDGQEADTAKQAARLRSLALHPAVSSSLLGDDSVSSCT